MRWGLMGHPASTVRTMEWRADCAQDETMLPMNKPVAILLSLTLAVGGVTAPVATAQGTNPVASVRTGSCLVPNGSGDALATVELGSAQAVADQAPSVIATIPRSPGALGSDDHRVVIEVTDGEEPRILACGDIGSGGEQAIALRAAGRDDPIGVAWLSDAGEDGSVVRIALTGAIAPAALADTGDPTCTTDHAVELGQRLKYAGWDVHVDGAAFDPVSGELAVDVRITNQTRRGDLSGRNIGLTFIEWDERVVPLSLGEQTTFIAGLTIRGRLSNVEGGRFPEQFSFCDAMLTFGRPTEYQTSVLMQPGAIAQEAAARQLEVKGTARLRGLDVSVRLHGGSLVSAECGIRQGRAFIKGPLEKDRVSIVLDVTERIGRVSGSISTSLISPDGVEWPIETRRVNGPTRLARQLCTVIPAPAEGRYVLVIDGGRREGRTAFTIPSAEAATR